MDGTIRVRSVAWFATAVVLTLVCTLLVTQAWSVGAAPGDDDSTFVPTAGCRLVDTRPSPRTVGPRNTPLAAGDIYEVTVRGSNGQCTSADGLAIPADAVGVALNVTATNATASSNIRVYPANLTTVPLLSNLNVTAGAPPTPNKVDVKLSPDGKIKVYNFNGSVNVILDVVGYYTDSSLKELAADLGTANSKIAALEALNTEARLASLEAAQPFAAESQDSSASVGTSLVVVVSLAITAPVDGAVTFSASSYANVGSLGTGLWRCGLGTGTTIDTDYANVVDRVDGIEFQTMSLDRVVSVASGATVTMNLVCDTTGGTATMFDSVITGIFTPAKP